MRLTIRDKKKLSKLISRREYANLNKNVLSGDLKDVSVCFDFIWSGKEFQVMTFGFIPLLVHSLVFL